MTESHPAPAVLTWVDPGNVKAVLDATFAKAAFRVEFSSHDPMTANTALQTLLGLCDGLQLAVVAVAHASARLGFEGLLRGLELGEDLWLDDAQTVTLSAAIGQRFEALEEADLRALIGLASFRSPFELSDASEAFGVDGATVRRLQRQRVLRSDGEVFRCSYFIARAARCADPEVAGTADAQLAAWGRKQRDAAFWVGDQAAIDRLERHLPSFIALAAPKGSGATQGLTLPQEPTPQARLDAFIAWGSACHRHRSLEAFVRGASDFVVRSATTETPSETRAILLLALAEAARLARAPGVAAEALSSAAPDHPSTARVQVIRARLAFGKNHLDEAKALCEQAMEAATRIDDPLGAAHGALTAAWVERARGALEASTRLSQHALTTFLAVGGVANAVEARLNMALVALSLGASKAALEHLSGPVPRLRVGNAQSFRCLSLELQGRYAEALDAIDQALAEPSTPLFRGIWSSYRGRILVALGDLPVANTALDLAAGTFEQAQAPASLTTVNCVRALGHAMAQRFDEARAALADASALCASEWLDRRAIIELATTAAEGIERARNTKGVDGSDVAQEALAAFDLQRPAEDSYVSIHVRAMHRFGLHLLEKCLKAAELHSTVVLFPKEARCRYLGSEFSLHHRPTLWRLLQVLSRHPFGLADDEAIEQTWVDEVLSQHSALNRLRVAVAELRRRGGAGLVLRREGAYRLGGPVRLVDESVPASGIKPNV